MQILARHNYSLFILALVISTPAQSGTLMLSGVQTPLLLQQPGDPGEPDPGDPDGPGQPGDPGEPGRP